MNSQNKKVTDAVVINNTSTTSDEMDLTSFGSLGWQVVATSAGTPTGTIQLQCSNGDSIWTNVGSSTAIAAAGNWADQVNFRYAKARLVITSSTAVAMTVSARIMAKAV